MSRTIKDKHLQIDYDIAIEITKRSKSKGCTEVEEYNYLLRNSLEFERIIERLNIMNKILDKVGDNCSYNRKLLEQLYCDLNMPIRDIKQSNNVNIFNKKYYNKRNKLND